MFADLLLDLLLFLGGVLDLLALDLLRDLRDLDFVNFLSLDLDLLRDELEDLPLPSLFAFDLESWALDELAISLLSFSVVELAS